MSWLSYVFLVLAALAVLRGARKGFLRMALSMGCMLLVLMITMWLNPRIGDYIRGSEKFYGKIEDACAGFLEEHFWNEVPDEAGKTPDMQMDLIKKLPVPEVIQKTLTENNNPQVYELLRVESFREYLAGSLAYWICSAIAFVVTFIVATMVVKLLMCVLDLLTELPGLSLVNTLGGMAIGLLQSLLGIWVFLIIVTIFCNTEIGAYLLREIAGDPFMNSLYENNLIMKGIFSVIGN